MHKSFYLLASAGLLILLCGCKKTQPAIPVQPASQISQAAQAECRYMGEVVSRQTIEIGKDSGKNIKERFVSAGQTVKKGDLLFTYDVDAARIAAEKQKLELEKIENEQAEFRKQLEDLEKQAGKAGGSEKNRLLLEISSLKNELLESEYRMKAKVKEQEALDESLKNGEVLSPVDGVIQKVSDSEDGPFLVIQQTGDFRIRGSINELNLNGDITEGTAVRVISRRDPAQSWNGTVYSVGTEPNQKEKDAEHSNSSSYPFIVELENSEGLLLGQHVYLEPASEEQDRLWLPGSFMENIREFPMEHRITADVWADNGSGKLEKISVTLGPCNTESGSYPVLTGLSPDHWIANPADEGCREGARTSGRTEENTSEEPAEKQPSEETGTIPADKKQKEEKE